MGDSPQIQTQAGGFIPPRNPLPSPAPTTASSQAAASLPHPRSKPLVPGSRKEDYVRDYVSRSLMHISRQYILKFGISDPADTDTGYESMEEVCRDLEEVIDVVWVSGTPSLQIPYLLNIALEFNTYLPSFPPAPRPTFALLRKLDHCFASLLLGYDVKTKEPLPGYAPRVNDSVAKMPFSGTDRVRCRSLALDTRLIVAVVMSDEEDVVDYEEDEYNQGQPRPARTRTEEADNIPRDCGGGTMEMDDEEEDINSLDFSSDDEDNVTSRKRNADEMMNDVVMTDQLAENRNGRVKAEDGGVPSVDLRHLVPANASPVPSPVPVEAEGSKTDIKGQFHWALEEDDESEREDDGTAKSQDFSHSGAILPSGRLSEPNKDEANNMDEDPYAPQEVNEEEEEMHMNVGKVYEKTLSLLGQSLGELITSD
ncbi:hypothetical protein GGS20DRAFT_411812 [Poronia punctata]|nr:hypothetical protein GGS20DRAFT_411812 [Poronia punctata]